MSKVDLNATTLDIAKNLIARQSVTPVDAGCQAFMADFLRPLGFETEHMDFEDTENIWSTRGQKTIKANANNPCFVFAGHTDVVPPGNLEQWVTPPFEPVVKDGMLHGRGAADMKGSLAAMLTATRKFVQAFPDHKGTIAFLITSDEEGPFINGTVRVIEELMKRGQPIDYCIVGEPSSTAKVGDVIKIGRRGSLTCWLTAKGVQGHVAYPHLADNAIHRAAHFIDELVKIEWDHGNEHFPPTSLQVTNFKAGEAVNIVPGEAAIEFNLRYSTEQTHQQIQSTVESLVKKHAPDFNIQWKLNGEPFLTQSHDLIDAVSSSIQQVCQIETSAQTSGGTSDGRFIAKTGAQIVELGPINKTIHQVNECVAVEDLETLSEIYYETLKRVLL
ncbi:succinyl-diaminopimelate desuccinylase [Aliikangiella marina]|uniref:Succinyl-diaminopimelate desuccinylase n=1 Tax=Aliikangiella marina TaxID=1712262 RepID=A0A545TE85_9GAMM|nr:succinyl-diaminopimelate desuccinylase [Aliikangiella marina]TQV75528.1 succinyl-diaminopimelate desuccinylase [Aliikangiella marina]